MQVKVAVIGGGLSGLFTGSELMSAGCDDIVVLESSDVPGGVARTVRRDGYLLEPGAGTLMLPNPDLTPILENFGATVAPGDPSSSLRYVYTRGRLVAIPPSPKALFAPVAPLSAKLRAAAEPWVKRAPAVADETVLEFMQRRFGKRLGGLIASVASSGVYAGDPAKVSIRAAFPAFPALEDAAGSVVRGGIRKLKSRPKGAVRASVHYAVGGMSALADAAARRLGERFRANSPVSAVRRQGTGWIVEGENSITADHVVLAVRPQAAARLVGGDIVDVLTRSVSAPTVVVGLGGTRARFDVPPGFGALIDGSEGMKTLGVLFESSHIPERAPEGHCLVKVIAGGARHPEVVDWDDERILDLVGRDVAKVVGHDMEASFTEIIRHPVGVPQYEVGHGDWLRAIDEELRSLPNLHLTGWSYRGIGVTRLAADALRIVGKIAGEV